MMEKQRLFKMTEIERNMLIKALCDIREDAETSEVNGLIRKAAAVPDWKLFLSEPEYRWSINALNVLRTTYLQAGRYSDGIDKVILKLMKSKYRRVPVR